MTVGEKERTMKEQKFSWMRGWMGWGHGQACHNSDCIFPARLAKTSFPPDVLFVEAGAMFALSKPGSMTSPLDGEDDEGEVIVTR